MIKTFFNIILYLLIYNFGYCQIELEGIVTDKISLEPLPFVEIVLKNGGNELKTQSDLEGKFYFKYLKSDTSCIKVSFIGYNTFDTITKLKDSSNILALELISSNTISTSYEYFQSSFNKKGALKDIKNGKIKLLLPGGFVGSPELPNDSIFEKKHNITFISQGCLRLPGENEADYNNEIFNYLDNKYGDIWRKEIRNDVIGFNK